MAQYTVPAGCGHTTTLGLYGPQRERDRRLAWMRSAEGECNACYAAGKREMAAAARQAEVADLLARMRQGYEAASPAERAEGLAELRGDLADGKGSPTQRQAVEQFLAELGGAQREE